MGVGASYAAPRVRLNASWTRTSICWSGFNGEPLSPPVANPDVGDAACFIRPSVVEAFAERVTLGPDAIRRRGGLLTVQVFVPKGAGEAQAASLATDLEALFRDYESNGVVYLEPVTRVIGPEPDSPWYQVNVDVPFRRDEIL